MIYHLLYSLADRIKIFNVFRYLTFRSMMAFLLVIVLVLYFQPKFIAWFRKKQMAQPIRDDGPQSHQIKQGTPTMGGLVVLLSVVLATLLLSDLRSIYVWVICGVTLGFGAIGFADDYLKVRVKNSKGINARQKLFWQFFIAAIAMICLVNLAPHFSTALTIPFFKEWSIDLGIFFVPFAMLVIVGTSNAVNLTDGLDGLMIGPVMSVSFAYGIFAYVSGNSRIAEYLHIPYIAGCGELAIFAAAVIAGGLGFLWFNSFPAQIFMGDVGSLSLGGALGMLAICTKQELVLIIAGGVFVVEAFSVILQVASFKWRGKRILRMAPIHHHFELGGIPEPKIIVRAWIISIVLAIISIATLKLR